VRLVVLADGDTTGGRTSTAAQWQLNGASQSLSNTATELAVNVFDALSYCPVAPM
jgi:hypothetical protein